LTKCDILVKHRFHGDGAHFELADKMPNHHHVICVETGRIVEFQDEQIQKIAERICAEYGYKLIRHSFQIFGVSEEKIGEAKQVEEFEFLET
jgi:Fur family ferric uptake transcriptional regulator